MSEKTLDYKDVESVKTKLCKLPQDMKLKEKELFKLNRKIADSMNAQKIIEADTAIIVANETVTEENKDGEKVEKRKYTNQEMRDNAVKTALFNSDPYQLLRKEIEDNQQLQSDEKIDFDYLRREMRAIDLLTKLMELER